MDIGRAKTAERGFLGRYEKTEGLEQGELNHSSVARASVERRGWKAHQEPVLGL